MMLRVLKSRAEGMIVVIELAWLRSISGADAPSPASAFSSGLRRPAITVLSALTTCLLSSFLATFEND
jgi:hypothetical protein